jgi:hypothetical protein
MALMKATRKSAPRIEVYPLEEFAGESDVPCYPAQAEAEAAELTEGPGGRFTFGPFRRGARRSAQYERQALDLRARALARLA